MSTRKDEPIAERDALLGTVLAGRYRVEGLIGSGGMGAVYRAEHVHMRKAVAVKVLHQEMNAFPEVVARFEREAVAAGRIHHPHVVSASDFGKLEDGSFYLVLEFIEGQSLAKLVAKEGALAPQRALRIARQIAEALQAAHGVGIVHRDLKPENVMLVDREDAADFVKVLDFGIAKVKVDETTEQPALTQIGTVFGTPEYMSPEQARGELVDARADLYTVGVILFEMLSGVSPFKDDDLVVVLTRHLTAEPPPLPADLDPSIRDLVLLLLRKNRAERVQSAQELLDRIAAIGTPASASAFAGASVSSGSSPDRAQEIALSPTLLGETSPEVAGQGALYRRRILLGSWRVPLWLVVLSGLASVVGIAALVVLGSLLFGLGLGGKSQASTLKDDASNRAVAKDSELARLIERAGSGEPTALAELSARSEQKRSRDEWRALGHGYAKLAQFGASLSAYQRGVALKPELVRDPQLLADVRAAALDATASDGALKFAAEALGAPGLDLIYDVWEAEKAVPSRALASKQARGYLDDDALRSKASPSLKILLEANKAQKEGCAAVKKWLARAATEGDERVVPALKRFEDRRGCGFLGLSDCYYCLRAGKDLAATADKVAGKAGPSFSAAP